MSQLLRGKSPPEPSAIGRVNSHHCNNTREGSWELCAVEVMSIKKNKKAAEGKQTPPTMWVHSSLRSKVSQKHLLSLLSAL